MAGGYPKCAATLPKLFSLCVALFAGPHSFAREDPSLLLERADVLFGKMEFATVQHLVDSIRSAPGSGRDAFAIASVLEARLAKVRGRLLDAYRLIEPLASNFNDSLGPLVQLAAAKEHARILKAMRILPKAGDAALKAHHFAQVLGRPKDQVDMLSLLAEIDRQQGRFSECFLHLNEAEDLANRSAYSRGSCNVHINRANLHYDQDKPQKALAGYHRALSCAQAGGFLDIARNATFNIGSAMHYLMSPKRVIAFYDSVLALKDLSADPAFEADVLNNIGTIANDAGDHERARKEIMRAMGIFTRLGDTTNIALSYQYISATYLSMGLLDSALYMAQRSAVISAASGLKELAADAESRLSEIYDRMGRCEEAMEHLITSDALRMELTRDKHSERMGFLEVQFETEKKEQALVLSQAQLQVSQESEKAKRNQRNWLIALTALLVLLALVLFRNYNGQKRLRAQEQVLYERAVNDLLKQQEINSLDAMMKGQEQERQRVGKDLHDRIGSMLSAVKFQFSALEGRMEQMESHQREQYEHVFNLLDETVTEVRRISHDMVRGTLSQFGLVRALEDLRSAVHAPGKLNVTMSVFGMDERLEQNLEIAVYRMVQECVSNAMKHAHAKELSVQLTRTAGSLNIIVEDDGTGFDMSIVSEGMGMGNIRERAQAHGGAVLVDSRPGHGTTVSIDLPLGRIPDIG